MGKFLPALGLILVFTVFVTLPTENDAALTSKPPGSGTTVNRIARKRPNGPQYLRLLRRRIGSGRRFRIRVSGRRFNKRFRNPRRNILRRHGRRYHHRFRRNLIRKLRKVTRGPESLRRQKLWRRSIFYNAYRKLMKRFRRIKFGRNAAKVRKYRKKLKQLIRRLKKKGPQGRKLLKKYLKKMRKHLRRRLKKSARKFKRVYEHWLRPGDLRRGLKGSKRLLRKLRRFGRGLKRGVRRYRIKVTGKYGRRFRKRFSGRLKRFRNPRGWVRRIFKKRFRRFRKPLRRHRKRFGRKFRYSLRRRIKRYRRRFRRNLIWKFRKNGVRRYRKRFGRRWRRNILRTHGRKYHHRFRRNLIRKLRKAGFRLGKALKFHFRSIKRFRNRHPHFKMKYRRWLRMLRKIIRGKNVKINVAVNRFGNKK